MKRSLLFAILALGSLSIAVAQTSKTIDAESFSKLYIAGNFKVFITQGSAQSVMLKGSAADIEEIQVSVEDGTLNAQPGDYDATDPAAAGTSTLELYITAPAFEEMQLQGTLVVQSKTPLTSQALALASNGPCSIALELNTGALALDVNGDGRLAFTGKANSLAIEYNGNGGVKATGLVAQNVAVNANGTGSIDVYAQDQIEAGCNGGVVIRYKTFKGLTVDTSNGCLRPIK
jgi:hypothetical protein